MKRVVLLTGASSQLGVFLLPRLVNCGFRVLALSRQAPAVPFDGSESIRWVRPGQETEPAKYLVSCGPLSLAPGLIERNDGMDRVIAFSTTSVLTKAASANRQERQLIAQIQAGEQQLVDRCGERDLALTLIRPTLIYGCGLDRNISLMARFGQRYGFIPLAKKAQGLRQPVHADDLAALAVRCLLAESAIRLHTAACGGSTISYREMMEKTAAACEKSVRLLTLNTGLLAAAVRSIALLPGYQAVNPEMVRRQSQDMTFDDSALRDMVDYRPRPFQPSSADFRIPAYAEVLQMRGTAPGDTVDTPEFGS